MEMAQLISCLLYKHEDLSLISWTHIFFKKAMCDGMCLQPQYQGGRGRQIFVVHWPISWVLGQWKTSIFTQGKMPKVDLWPPHAHAHTHAACTHHLTCYRHGQWWPGGEIHSLPSKTIQHWFIRKGAPVDISDPSDSQIGGLRVFLRYIYLSVESKDCPQSTAQTSIWVMISNKQTETCNLESCK